MDGHDLLRRGAIVVTLVVSFFTQQSPVEQQTPGGATQPDRSLWVVNSTPCVWDADDIYSAWWTGPWRSGQSASTTLCVVGDWTAHLFALAADPALTLTLRSESGAVATGHGQVCLVGPDYDHQFPGFAPVVGSNGGVGVVETITYTVVNETRHRIRSVAFIRARLSLSDSIASLCPSLVWSGSLDPRWLVGE